MALNFRIKSNILIKKLFAQFLLYLLLVFWLEGELKVKIIAGLCTLGVIGLVILCVQSMESSVWSSFIYFYGLGWPVFVGSCWLMIRSGAIQLKVSRDRFMLGLVVLGLFLFTVIHAFWIFYAVNSLYKGV